MTQKLKYEKPMFFDLSGNDAMIAQGQLDFMNCGGGNGAVGSCKGGNGASGACSSGNNAVVDCFSGNNAQSYSKCVSGNNASQSCSFGTGVRHS